MWLRHLQAEHLGRRVDVDDVVEHELVSCATVDVSGEGSEREAGQVFHGWQGKVQQRVGKFRDRCCHLLVFRADQQHHTHLVRRDRRAFQLAEDGGVAVQPQIGSPRASCQIEHGLHPLSQRLVKELGPQIDRPEDPRIPDTGEGRRFVPGDRRTFELTVYWPAGSNRAPSTRTMRSSMAMYRASATMMVPLARASCTG